MLYAGIAMYFVSQDIDKIKEEFGVRELTVEDEDALKADLRAYLQLHKP
jgi:thiamine pyrophosphate-dependent acetolactate synthase large subunit-like protein